MATQNLLRQTSQAELIDLFSMFNQNARPVLLFYHPSMKTLAIKVRRAVMEKPTSTHDDNDGTLQYRMVELRDDIEWKKFSDGWPNIFIHNIDKVRGSDVIFLASFHNPDAMFEQLSILYSFPGYLVKSFVVILPLFTTGTMERIDKEGQIATAKVLANLLSAIPLTQRGPVQIVIFDIHALQERFYFSESAIPRLETALPLLKSVINRRDDCNSISIAFPDDGACKRFQHQVDQWPIIICAKVKEGDKRIITVKEGVANGRHVVIVDDLVMTGGTLIECANALYARGALAVSMYVTHAIFPNETWKKFTHEHSKTPYDSFWITDSVPGADEIAKNPPFKLLSLAERIAESLLSYDLRLFNS